MRSVELSVFMFLSETADVADHVVCRYRAPELLLGSKIQTTAIDMWYAPHHLFTVANIGDLTPSFYVVIF